MSNEAFTPFDQSHRLQKLLLVITVVGRGQGDAIIALANQCESNFSFLAQGKGTAPNAFYSILGNSSLKKDVVFSIVKQSRYERFAEALQERFSVSKMAKGISFTIEMSSVAGVSIYKYLSNTRLIEKPIRKRK